MKVRWSSTYVMLYRAESRKQVCGLLLYQAIVLLTIAQAVNEFIIKVGLKESNSEKRSRFTDLALSEEEWERVRLFCNLLQVCTRVILAQAIVNLFV